MQSQRPTWFYATIFRKGPEGAGGLPSVILTDETPSLGLFRFGVSGIVPRIASASQIVAALHAAAAGVDRDSRGSDSAVIRASPRRSPRSSISRRARSIP